MNGLRDDGSCATINLRTYTTDELWDLFEAVQEELNIREEEEQANNITTINAVMEDHYDEQQYDDEEGPYTDDEEQDVFDEDEDEEEHYEHEPGAHHEQQLVVAEPQELEEVKVTLKPRCNVLSSLKEFRYNQNIGTVELDVWKNWLRDANEEQVWALFDALGQHPTLQKLTFRSRGASTQHLPVSHLTHLLGEATHLREFFSEHIRWQGDPDDFELLAATLGEHLGLKSITLMVESADLLHRTIGAAGKIPTLERIEVKSAHQAVDTAGLTQALQSLCHSPSLKSLKLIHVSHKLDAFTKMAQMLCNNRTLQELYIQATDMDVKGGMAMAEMVASNQGLSSCTFKLDQMQAKKLGDAFIRALDVNYTLNYFQIALDGRTCDIKTTRAMQMEFRKLKPKYKVSSQVGLTMGVTVEPLDEDVVEYEQGEE